MIFQAGAWASAHLETGGNKFGFEAAARARASASIGRPLTLMDRGPTFTSIDALSVSQLEDVLGHLRDVAFFLHDAEQRFIAANKVMLELCGVERRDELIGRRAGEFFDDATRRRFEAAHQAVIQARKPTRHRLEKVVTQSGRGAWLVFGRWPVIRGPNQVQGVAVIARVLAASERKDAAYKRVADAVAMLHANPSGRVSAADLARAHGGSVSQLERDFAAVFGVSPRRFHSQLRLEMAVDLLGGDQSIAEIAYACGYKDQSAFSRQFSAVFGASPSGFRAERRAGREQTAAALAD